MNGPASPLWQDLVVEGVLAEVKDVDMRNNDQQGGDGGAADDAEAAQKSMWILPQLFREENKLLAMHEGQVDAAE